LPNKVPRGNVPDCRQEAAEGGLFFLQGGSRDEDTNSLHLPRCGRL